MKLHFGHLVGLGALAIGGCAAFFSVYGISQLFAGAFVAVVIMASSLEFGKLILASHLQRYWSKLGKIRRLYLSTLVIFLMIITSAGIYGLLSSAYQKTYTEYTIMENETLFLEQKEGFYQSDVDKYDKDISQINDIILQKNNSINQYSGAKVTSLQYKDKETGNLINTISTAEIKAAKTNIKRETDAIALQEIKKREIEVKRITAIDSLNSYKMQILTLRNNTDISGELGPLIYLKELTGLPMDKVVNFFIILLVFVFDPLAIMLVLEANRIFEDERIKREKLTDPLDVPKKNTYIQPTRLTDEEFEVKNIILDDVDKLYEIDDTPTPIIEKEKEVEPITIEYVADKIIEEELIVEELIVEEPIVEEPIVEGPIQKAYDIQPEPVRNKNTVTSISSVSGNNVESPNIKDIKKSSTRKFTKPIPRRGNK